MGHWEELAGEGGKFRRPGQANPAARSSQEHAMERHLKDLSSPQSDSPHLVLEMKQPGAQSARKFPVTLKTLSPLGATLRLGYPGIDCWRLDGQAGSLCLRPKGGAAPITIRGSVTLLTPLSPRGEGNLIFAFMEPLGTTYQVLEALLPAAAEDLKELWNQWDQAQSSPGRVFAKRCLYLVAGLGGVALLAAAGAYSLRLFG